MLDCRVLDYRMKFVAGWAAAVLLTAGTASGNFSTVVDAPPAKLARDANFGSGTQVNLREGSQAEGRLTLGGPRTAVADTQLNLLGETPRSSKRGPGARSTWRVVRSKRPT